MHARIEKNQTRENEENRTFSGPKIHKVLLV